MAGRWWWPAGVLAVYLLLTAVYTSPLLRLSGTHIAADPGDPILNAAVLWWDATTVPFSDAWWNAPHFYPSEGVASFTENLQGLTPVSTPLFWLTRNALTTYNLTLWLTWPLSAFAAYLLVRHLTAREDAAVLAGLAWAFSPYRASELSHVQMLASWWMPLALLGLHGYLRDRRRAWLLLFGTAWLLQSLANGYLMLFGAVLIVCWLAYFCSTRRTWTALPPVLGAWGIASLPLVPIMLTYREVHEHYGLRRILSDPLAISSPVWVFGHVSPIVRLWARWLPDTGDNLFPGVTAVLLVAAAAAAVLRAPIRNSDGRTRFAARCALTVILLVSLAATVATLLVGPWRVAPLGIVIRMMDIDRAVSVAGVSGALLIALSTRARRVLARRSPLAFYTAATLLMAVFSCGPVLRVGNDVVFAQAPYRFVMMLPGFTELRVPARFWMMGVLCLGVAAGLSLARLSRPRTSRARVLFVTAVAGVLIDGWLVEVPMADAPQRWGRVERADRPEPILELPLGPAWDAAATFRTVWHHRRVVNGVSGYDPAHYDPLHAGLNARDPSVLTALAALGALDIVVDGSADPDGSWARYAASIDGAVAVGTDGVRTVYRVPATTPLAVTMGPALPIAGVSAFRHDPRAVADGDIATEWGDDPQRPGQWVTADLGQVRDVAGVSCALGEYARDFPRLLTIDLSVDGDAWDEVWRGGTVGQAFIGAVRDPRDAELRFAFAPHPARFVRLRQLAVHRNMWRIAELRVHAPAQ